MSQQRNTVIVVNEQDEWLGTMEKLAVHQEGVLHRAISVFVFNDRGELLLQQRAEGKYHSAGQWSNTCCSHPMPGESSLSAAHRRLKEEMGFETTLVPLFDLRYKANVGHGLIENEFDHIFIGCYNAPPAPDPSEVRAAQYLDSAAILRWMEREPEAFTSWFHLAFSKVLMHLEQQAAA